VSACASLGRRRRSRVHQVRPAGLRSKRAHRAGWEMNAVDVGAWNANWAWSQPLIVLNVVIHVIGLAVINGSVVPVLSAAMERHRFRPAFALLGRHRFVGYRTARNRGRHLGHRLLASRRPTRRQVCDALFAQRNDNQSRGPLFRSSLATDWCSGGAKRDASVRADHRLSVRHDSEGLAAGKQRTAPEVLSGIGPDE
jgi:hypothetical protein